MTEAAKLREILRLQTREEWIEARDGRVMYFRRWAPASIALLDLVRAYEIAHGAEARMGLEATLRSWGGVDAIDAAFMAAAAEVAHSHSAAFLTGGIVTRAMARVHWPAELSPFTVV